jgi:twitching motility protein PilJ
VPEGWIPKLLARRWLLWVIVVLAVLALASLLGPALMRGTVPLASQCVLAGVALVVGVLAWVGLAGPWMVAHGWVPPAKPQAQVQVPNEPRDAAQRDRANQEAILRLMDELQVVASGDLTHEATVTEDFTGAIADTVNYTVEELRTLVASVQRAAARVTQTTGSVEASSATLLQASQEQLQEIRATGQAVLDMAGRINVVSGQAQQSAEVARRSLRTAESGLNAVHSAMGGMSAIRNQIRETAKRIKRLGESSQEIGEITALISSITEQTNVLALNAAIQAASAGEAGRGFSVVAEEVQRLAERSSDAARQIAALVDAIQTDTQDAISAMERSTRGVVNGARLSDDAGSALSEIDLVSRQLATLIETISKSTAEEARRANQVAGSIQRIFTVTEQNEASTRGSAHEVRGLAQVAEELRQSVARFKIV